MGDDKNYKVEIVEDSLKYEIAEQLGLLDKILKDGWAGLTAKESGRIGGLMTARRRGRNIQKKKYE
ncbi:alpha/beta-type small acid-soluble spore protein [Paratissierella segnis]|uniref:Small, acid-soluble spore protein, alpha/beta type n=1 Tax=Paratissierella segnis TaxID=2763679 RepID=A0A926ILH6_9FIRM|nr:alpha/beta-type small acid-soluble spore protein [Paratissierella segnis]MBC8589380.1 small, acid-soluble spore protein, alpha/beta type [Paratissierella segnis]